MKISLLLIHSFQGALNLYVFGAISDLSCVMYKHTFYVHVYSIERDLLVSQFGTVYAIMVLITYA